MKSLGFIRDAFGICAAAALLASCSTSLGAVPRANAGDATAPLQKLATSRHNERVLWSFTNRDKIGDGDPTSNLILDNKGALYGTFTLSTRFENGGGVFKLTPSGSNYSESMLHGFQGGNDGANPAAGLVFDKKGALYSTTAVGGGVGCSFGCGTVFKLKPSGSGYSESVLYRFAGTPDGANPHAGLILDDKGALYGTTSGGGVRGYGTVFELTPSGSGYSESILYSFRGGKDGAHPYAGLIFDKKGALYGTTSGGGYNGSGTLFKLTPSKSGYSKRTLYRFRGGGDGANPYAGLIFGKSGALYGTTAGGGNDGFGVVFKLTPLGSSKYADEILLSFGGRNGAHSYAGLVFGKKGELYGTTSGGGRFGFGTAFKLTPSGSGYSQRYSESILHHFNFNNGASPEAGLTFGATGALYGTTSGGGDHGYNGFGTVFELAS
ncbi:MAG: choice-of-anchor tandem repeat GloVer-containing protein [Candidatus Cybelea sp.]